MLFGIEPFKARRGDDSQSGDGHTRTENCEEENEKIEEEETTVVHNLLQLLSGFLDSEVRNIIKFALSFVLKCLLQKAYHPTKLHVNIT